jgi:hypothetical protein
MKLQFQITLLGPFNMSYYRTLKRRNKIKEKKKNQGFRSIDPTKANAPGSFKAASRPPAT